MFSLSVFLKQKKKSSFTFSSSRNFLARACTLAPAADTGSRSRLCSCKRGGGEKKIDYWWRSGQAPDNRGVDVADGEGEGDPAGDGEQHQHLPGLESEKH